MAFGNGLLSLALPLLATVAELLSPDFTGRLELIGDTRDAALHFSALTVHRIPIDATTYVPLGTRFDPAKASALHALVPVVLLLAGLAAWPAAGWIDAGVRAALAVPLMFLVLALTVPFHLVGLTEIALAGLKAQGGAPPKETWRIAYMIFLESGGRWLLPIVLAALAVVGGAALDRFVRAPRQSRRRRLA